MSARKYGWKPDIPDHRDYVYEIPKKLGATTLPSSFDLRDSMPVVYDQRQANSCVGNAVSGLFQYDAIQQNLEQFKRSIPSRMFAYYNARLLDGGPMVDGGATIRSGIKAVVNYGICTAPRWPYVLKKVNTKPTAAAYTAALPFKAVEYRRLNQASYDLRFCIASKSPIVCGIAVYDSFESEEVAKTGVVPMPTKEERMLGGHAVLIVGYSDKKKFFIVRNSWGEGWGNRGYCYIPYDFILNSDLATDFWTITKLA